MDKKEKDLVIMADLIIYGRLGKNPTNEEIKSLLDEYENNPAQENGSKQQSQYIINRLNEALNGESLYAGWHERFRKRTEEIERSLG